MSDMTSTKPYVIAKRAVWEAYQQVKANRGAAGIDDETIVMFEQNLSRNLYKLWNRMSSGSYFPPPVMQDTHPYTISVARNNNFQNMEFLDAKSLKPYEPQVKPLLQWWKAMRVRHMPESSSSADTRCALDKTHAVFSQ